MSRAFRRIGPQAGPTACEAARHFPRSHSFLVFAALHEFSESAFAQRGSQEVMMDVAPALRWLTLLVMNVGVVFLIGT